MGKMALGVMLSGSILVLAATFIQRHALACELLPVLNKLEIKNEIFVASDLSAEKIDILKKQVDSALSRIEHVYGTPISRPRILITSNTQMAATWGANAIASMHRMPWRSCIIIGPEGQNVDVLAHEWLHAEIQHRVGFLRFLKEVPVWFDEGAALTLDYREPFLPENITLPESEIQAVKNLISGRAFFAGNIMQNYQAARMAVDPLILNDHFFDDLERISVGEPFASVFLITSKTTQ